MAYNNILNIILVLSQQAVYLSFLPSSWLLSNITIVKTMDSGAERNQLCSQVMYSTNTMGESNTILSAYTLYRIVLHSPIKQSYVGLVTNLRQGIWEMVVVMCNLSKYLLCAVIKVFHP